MIPICDGQGVNGSWCSREALARTAHQQRVRQLGEPQVEAELEISQGCEQLDQHQDREGTLELTHMATKMTRKPGQRGSAHEHVHTHRHTPLRNCIKQRRLMVLFSLSETKPKVAHLSPSKETDVDRNSPQT